MLHQWLPAHGGGCAAPPAAWSQPGGGLLHRRPPCPLPIPPAGQGPVPGVSSPPQRPPPWRGVIGLPGARHGGGPSAAPPSRNYYYYYWGTPPHATAGGAWRGRRSCWAGDGGTGVLPSSCHAGGTAGPASSALPSATSFVLFLLFFSFCCWFRFCVSCFFLLREERLPVLLPPPPAAPCPSHPRAGAPGKGAARRPGALRRRSLLLWPGPSALCLCPAGRLSCWPARARPRSARGRRAGARCHRSGWSS